MQKSKHQTLLTYLKIHSQSKQLKTDIHKYLHFGRCERSLVACVRGRARCAEISGGGRRARRARGTCTARPARRHNTARAARAGDGQGTRPPTDAAAAPPAPSPCRCRPPKGEVVVATLATPAAAVTRRSFVNYLLYYSFFYKRTSLFYCLSVCTEHVSSCHIRSTVKNVEKQQ